MQRTNFVPRCVELAEKGEKQDKLTRPSITALVPTSDGGGVSLRPELRTYYIIWRFTNRDWLKHTHTHTRITPSPSQIRRGVCLVDSHRLEGCSRACLHSQWGPEQQSTSQKIISMSADCRTPVFAKGHNKDMKTIRNIYSDFYRGRLYSAHLFKQAKSSRI